MQVTLVFLLIRGLRKYYAACALVQEKALAKVLLYLARHRWYVRHADINAHLREQSRCLSTMVGLMVEQVA